MAIRLRDRTYPMACTDSYTIYHLDPGLPTIWACVILLVVATHLAWRHINSTSLRLPPGPKGLPILGNIHQVSKDYQERIFARWANKYGTHIRYICVHILTDSHSMILGDLMFAKFFAQRALIINSQAVARDLLDKRGGIYSSRPRFVMFCEM